MVLRPETTPDDDLPAEPAFKRWNMEPVGTHPSLLFSITKPYRVFAGNLSSNQFTPHTTFFPHFFKKKMSQEAGVEGEEGTKEAVETVVGDKKEEEGVPKAEETIEVREPRREMF